jgi:glyoxylase I family protein
VKIEGFDHIVIRVHDLERSIKFYTNVLNCQIERARMDLGLVHLRAGNAFIDLIGVNTILGQKGGDAPSKGGRNLDHFCLRVVDFQITKVIEHLKKHNVEIGDTGTRFGSTGDGESIYIYDPDTNQIELR